MRKRTFGRIQFGQQFYSTQTPISFLVTTTINAQVLVIRLDYFAASNPHISLKGSVDIKFPVKIQQFLNKTIKFYRNNCRNQCLSLIEYFFTIVSCGACRRGPGNRHCSRSVVSKIKLTWLSS